MTLVAGWGEWTGDTQCSQGRKKLNSSELRNATSIVVRLEYMGNSVLFAGDTIGRCREDPDDSCIAAESFMVENHNRKSNPISIKSDVLIAPHHGGNNGSSTDFIIAVEPSHVIFSAGHKHHHPTHATVERYKTTLGDKVEFLRTDLGDNELDKNGKSKEWKEGVKEKRKKNVDPVDDDDIDLVLKIDGRLHVGYRRSESN